MSLSPTKVTLEEYLHAHKLQKKLEYRKRSRSKNKQTDFEAHQKSSLSNIYRVMDTWSYQFKTKFHQFLSADPPKQKVLFYLITNLDKFILKVKEEIRNMYKEAEMHYNAQHIYNRDPKIVEYFKEQHDIADLEIKKAHLAEMMKENTKDDKKKDDLLEAILLTSNRLSHKEPTKFIPETPNEQDGGPVDFLSAMLGLSKKQSQRSPEPKSEPYLPPKESLKECSKQPVKHPGRQNNLLGVLISSPKMESGQKVFTSREKRK